MIAMLENPCFAYGMIRRMTIDGGRHDALRTGLNIREKRASASTFATFAPVKG